MAILLNYPLMAALAAVVLAQFLKVPIFYVARRRWVAGLAFGSGGMPSSHSAAVASLAAAVAVQQGVASAAFAVAVVVSVITMYDAAGVRRQTGLHATVLNRLVRAVPDLRREERGGQPLREPLGHRPIEVVAGALLGIAVGVSLHWVY